MENCPHSGLHVEKKVAPPKLVLQSHVLPPHPRCILSYLDRSVPVPTPTQEWVWLLPSVVRLLCSLTCSRMGPLAFPGLWREYWNEDLLVRAGVNWLFL